jgi:hypothetical protein
MLRAKSRPPARCQRDIMAKVEKCNALTEIKFPNRTFPKSATSGHTGQMWPFVACANPSGTNLGTKCAGHAWGLCAGSRRLRARPRLARFWRDGVDLHVRQSCVPEAERLGGGSRNIDDASTDERPPIHDPEDHGAAIIKIEDFDPRSHRQAAMRCDQSSCAIIGGQPELLRRCAEAHAESNRAKDEGLSQRRRSCASCSLGVRRNANTKLTNLVARCRPSRIAWWAGRGFRDRTDPATAVCVPAAEFGSFVRGEAIAEMSEWRRKGFR